MRGISCEALSRVSRAIGLAASVLSLICVLNFTLAWLFMEPAWASCGVEGGFTGASQFAVLILVLAADWNKFFHRMRGYGSIWCCVNQHPGHIHYDPWFDIPHTDKFNNFVQKWEPKCGP